MNTVSRSVAAAIAVVVVIVASALRTRGEPSATVQTAAAERPRAWPTAAVRARVAAAEAPRPPAREAASLQRRIERLALGTPRERYEAFDLLARCAHAIDFDRYVKALPAGTETARLRERYGDGSARIAAACGDLSARLIGQRVELAASAADDGVPGAASAWIEEGPFGDTTALTQRPEDPLVVEWAEQAIARVHAATKRADTDAISQFGLLCLNWELNDVARVRLLVETALERRREDFVEHMLN
jgi:hypothetical protein